MEATAVIPVKAVPGSSRDEVVGWLGGHLKVRVAAPPEGGQANRAICKLLASEFGLKASAAAITHGAGSPIKTVSIAGITLEDVERRWPRRS